MLEKEVDMIRNDEVKVSVCCMVYNQEKYLERMLDSVVSQKCDFRYEILIHDDASTDASPTIIMNYAKKYPDLIRPILQMENQYSKGIKISQKFLYPLVKGQYIAFCEGDDYWTDEYKLHKQYCFMEQNKDCSICTHYVQPIKENGNIMENSLIPSLRMKTGLIIAEKYAEMIIGRAECTFQLSSYFIRFELVKGLIKETPEFMLAASAGDEGLQRYCINKGDLFFISDTMSCYRVNSIGSWNMRENSTIEKKEKHCLAMKQMDVLFNEFSNYRFHEIIEAGLLYRDFLLLIQKKEYRKLYSIRHRKCWKNRSFKNRIKLYILSIFSIFGKKYESSKI